MYHKIRRAIVVPSFPQLPPAPTTDDNVEYLGLSLKVLQQNYSYLAREVVDCHNQVLAEQLTVAGAAVLRLWTLPAAFFDVNYSAYCTPDWNTTVWYSGKLRNQITFNFGTAAPGGGGNVLLFAIR